MVIVFTQVVQYSVVDVVWVAVEKHRVWRHSRYYGRTRSLYNLRIPKTEALVLDRKRFSQVGNDVLAALEMEHFEYFLEFI